MSTTTINIRIDKKMKANAKKVAEKLGIDLSSAVKIFISKFVSMKGIPFEVRTINGFTEAQEMKMIKETEWALKHGKRYTSAKEMLDDILR